MLVACFSSKHSNGGNHDAKRSDRKAARCQTRKRLELEIYLRKHWRLFGGADRWRDSRPDEAHEAASREGGRAVRFVESRGGDAERSADAWAGLADAADRPADLS